MINIKKKWKCLLFLINVFFIISTETIYYVIFKDFSNLIDKLATKLSSINILYVKFFQAFALNNKLIDEKLNNYLRTVAVKTQKFFLVEAHNCFHKKFKFARCFVTYCTNYNLRRETMDKTVFWFYLTLKHSLL